MSIWSNATVTQKGYALQGKLLSTKALEITRVVSGASCVPGGQLIVQTAVSDIKQTLEIEDLTYQDNGVAVIKVYLDNYSLQTGYTIWQVGIYAADPDEGEILYAIAQTNAGEYIPSITEQPVGFSCEWAFYLAFSNGDNISVNISPTAFITQKVADNRYSSKEHQHSISEINELQNKINSYDENLNSLNIKLTELESQQASNFKSISTEELIELSDEVKEINSGDVLTCLVKTNAYLLNNKFVHFSVYLILNGDMSALFKNKQIPIFKIKTGYVPTKESLTLVFPCFFTSGMNVSNAHIFIYANPLREENRGDVEIVLSDSMLEDVKKQKTILVDFQAEYIREADS